MDARLRQIVEIAIYNHPKDCIFTPNAVENVMTRLDGESFSGDVYSPSSAALMDLIAEAIEAEEIYCPHEGIDRRDEYYASVNTAGWSDWSAIAHEMI